MSIASATIGIVAMISSAFSMPERTLHAFPAATAPVAVMSIGPAARTMTPAAAVGETDRMSRIGTLRSLAFVCTSEWLAAEEARAAEFEAWTRYWATRDTGDQIRAVVASGVSAYRQAMLFECLKEAGVLPER